MMPDDAPFYLGINHTKTEKNIGHLKPSIISTQVTTQTATKETAATSTSKTPMSFLNGAVVSGGQFTISINALQTTSPTTIQTAVPSPKPPKVGRRESELSCPTPIKV